MYSFEDVILDDEELIHLDYDYYLYIIYVNHIEVGRITFRLGTDEQFALDGHIGYEIEEHYRGHNYAYQACMALKDKIKEYYDHIIITCDEDNLPSKKTIMKLGAKFQIKRNIPTKLQIYYPGSVCKEIYRWEM